MPRELSNISIVNGVIEIFANEIVEANKPLIIKAGQSLKILCKGTSAGIILNKQRTQNGANKYFLPSIIQEKGSNLTIVNIIGEQQTWQNPQQTSQWDCNIFLKSNGGITKAENFFYKEGYGFQLELEAELEWTNGGSWWKPQMGPSLSGSPYKYAIYTGNADWDQGNLAKKVIFSGSMFC